MNFILEQIPAGINHSKLKTYHKFHSIWWHLISTFWSIFLTFHYFFRWFTQAIFIYYDQQKEWNVKCFHYFITRMLLESVNPTLLVQFLKWISERFGQFCAIIIFIQLLALPNFGKPMILFLAPHECCKISTLENRAEE